jgi:hypothetical protein
VYYGFFYVFWEKTKKTIFWKNKKNFSVYYGPNNQNKKTILSTKQNNKAIQNSILKTTFCLLVFYLSLSVVLVWCVGWFRRDFFLSYGAFIFYLPKDSRLVSYLVVPLFSLPKDSQQVHNMTNHTS